MLRLGYNISKHFAQALAQSEAPPLVIMAEVINFIVVKGSMATISDNEKHAILKSYCP